MQWSNFHLVNEMRNTFSYRQNGQHNCFAREKHSHHIVIDPFIKSVYLISQKRGHCNAGVCVCVCVCVCLSAALYHTITSLNVDRLSQNLYGDSQVWYPHHEKPFDVMTNVLRSWCTCWRHDAFWTYEELFWRHDVYLKSWRTYWHHGKVHDILTNFLTSWRICWPYDAFFMCSWRHDALFDFMTHFLTSSRTHWRHNTLLLS